MPAADCSAQTPHGNALNLPVVVGQGPLSARQKFLFDDTPVRGELVHLDAAWQAILERQEYPEPVRKILGEMLAAAVLLSAILKLNGCMVIQLRGNGPINLLMVECANSHEVRGLAHWQSIPDKHDLKTLFGNGTLSITLEPREEQTQYQSVVEIVGENLSDALSKYLEQSEQLETALWLAADEHSASGMLIQRLPEVSAEKIRMHGIASII